jgi:hypothetical protein
MATEMSGELLRLLSTLSVRAHGASQYELAAVEGVSAGVTYKAVMLDLVYAESRNLSLPAARTWSRAPVVA